MDEDRSDRGVTAETQSTSTGFYQHVDRCLHKCHSYSEGFSSVHEGNQYSRRIILMLKMLGGGVGVYLCVCVCAE